MLDQGQADYLRDLVKKLASMDRVVFPPMGGCIMLSATCMEEKVSFRMDVNRKGRKKKGKCTYQNSLATLEVLVRVDLDGPTHTNPDGEDVPCPHVHIYKEGYGDKWAYPLPPGSFRDTTDLVVTLIDFLTYCKVAEVPDIQRPMI